MKILVINAGSSSMKFQLIDMTNESVLAKGICDRVGIDGTYKQKNADGKVYEAQISMPTHTDAFEILVKSLSQGECRVISDVSEISAVGHRVVHGGEKYSHSVRVDETVIADIEALSELAPLHNPGAVQGIRGCLKVFGDKLPQVVVFDTAFHQTMPPQAYLYPIPYEYYEKYKIRRYGFHGTSHQFVSERCAELMKKDIKDLKIVTCHLGNGSSITAVSGGKSVDTTMGLTPLEGVMMGTRSGSIDPSIVTFLQRKENLTPNEIDYILNKKSGILGLGGVSSDDRDNRAATEKGNMRTKQAREVQMLSVKKLLAAMAASMGGMDAVVFTGGIGENVDSFRAGVCDGLDYLGIELDSEKNEKTMFGVEDEISVKGSKTRVYVIPTNEELVIARDTMRLSK
ncbi:MAG TPA: acetate kinase [Oscillospiraceae bacterium]|nr:acetate kinase [Oscillospiraceae bacterium]HPF57062.1 acetate kinase [Clostridiales bacterium]HPK34291.1 acetate kinase [Oscillospiraceae bacterium]HPR74806.1 acetate kinase [Oscillospiraceae bacterium]